MAKPMDEGATARWPEPFNLFSERCSNMTWPQQARMNGHSAMLCTLIKPALTAPLDRVHADEIVERVIGGGARLILRHNSERSDPTAPQTYGYMSELFASPRHAEVDPGVRFGQAQVILLHYLALLADGALPSGKAVAAWRKVPKPPYCDADGRPRALPEVTELTSASTSVGTPVASRRHPGETPAVRLQPAILEPKERTHASTVPRRRFYDNAVAFAEQLLLQVDGSAERSSRLRAELQYLGSAAALLLSKQHARLDLRDPDSFAEMARDVLSSRFMYEQLGAPAPAHCSASLA